MLLMRLMSRRCPVFFLFHRCRFGLSIFIKSDMVIVSVEICGPPSGEPIHEHGLPILCVDSSLFIHPIYFICFFLWKLS